MTDPSDNRSLLTGGLIVAAVTVISYALAFTYETGFAAFFHIPDALIEVDLTVVLRVFSGLLGIIPMGYMFLEFVGVHIWARLSRPIRGVVLILFIDLIGFLFLVAINGFSISIVVFAFAVLPALVLGPYLLIAFVTRQANGGYLKALQNIVEKTEEDRLAPRLVSRIGVRTVIAGYLLALIALMLYGFGYYRARSQSEYYVIQSSPPRVVLRFYPDAVITTSFDAQTRTVGRTIDILRKNAVDRMDLRYENIGPLRSHKRNLKHAKVESK